MMDLPSTGLLLVLFLILAAEFVNGFTDAPNAIATVVSTRVLSPLNALSLATVLNFVGAAFALLTGAKVASTIGKDIVNPEVVDLTTVGAAMIAIVFWSLLAWVYGLPTSESHALISGLAGAAIAKAGTVTVLKWAGFQKVLIGLAFSTFLGFGGGLLLMTAIYWIFRNHNPWSVKKSFSRAQIVSAGFMAFSHGSNDGQKFIGAFTLTLFISGQLPSQEIPWWVVVLCGVVMAVGTACGGWRIVKTMGLKLTKLEPVHGFAAETGAALTIELATHLGIPLSTTHTINTSIMGVGATRRLTAVRWGVSQDIITAWLLTFPVCTAVSYGITKVALLIWGK